MEATWGDGGGDAVEQGRADGRTMDERGVGRFDFLYIFLFLGADSWTSKHEHYRFLFGCDSSYKNVQFRLAPRNV
jgi:hypothetical protein